MAGKLVVDTNAVIAFRAGIDKVVNLISEATAVFIPAIVLGELLYGAMNSANSNRNLEIVRKFLEHFILIHVDEQTAWKYAEIRSNLKLIGKPIPENDIWIAAMCKKLELPLLTRDEYFNNVPGKEILSWQNIVDWRCHMHMSTREIYHL